MYLTRCPKCKCDFELTADDLNKQSVSCPTCLFTGGWDRGSVMDVDLPDVKMTGSITPPPVEVPKEEKPEKPITVTKRTPSRRGKK